MRSGIGRPNNPMPKEKPFVTEAALCAEFIDWADTRYWTAYPETAGWDILMVRKADGFQIGIQAKLRMCVEVVNQAIEHCGGWYAAMQGPDCRAILVPTSGGFGPICAYLGLAVIYPTYRSQLRSRANKWNFQPHLPEHPGAYDSASTIWPEWCPTTRCDLPAYVPDSIAGSPSPIQLTEWKIKAIKLAIIVERRGHALRSDFKALQLDHRRWIDGNWLIATRAGLTRGPNFPDLKVQHPRNYLEIAADFAAWAPKDVDRLL